MILRVILVIIVLQLQSSLQDFCGNSVVSSGLIVGGGRIKRGQWPFIAALFSTRNGEYFCGGTVISKRHVITAGR